MTGTTLTDDDETTVTEAYDLVVRNVGAVYVFLGDATPVGKNLSAGDSADVTFIGTTPNAHLGTRLGGGGSFSCSASTASSRFPWLWGLFAALAGVPLLRVRSLRRLER